MGERPGNARRTTQCYVHSLIEEQRNSGHYTPSHEGIVQNKKADKDPQGRGPDTPDGKDGKEQNQSRLLTKKQLSDMAFGIRELAKKLAHIRLKLN
ncbi:hypothetical protein LTS18_006454, partial [Coniosporium uncinatum]